MIDTAYIKDEITRCEDVDELRERVFPLIKSQQESWSVKIREVLNDTGYSQTRFAELCNVSRPTVNKWCNGAIPKNRETFLRIGMVACYDKEKMNQLLQRYGRYPALYSKSLEDCICLFVINNDYGKEAFEKYRYILNKIRDSIVRADGSELEDVSTVKFDEKLADVHDENELEQFINENATIFTRAYHKFYAYVKMNIQANYMDRNLAGSIFEMAEIQGWSSSLRQCVSAIRQSKWYPTRNKIISLGLHLSMDHDQINEMLSLAHMEPLCGKNLFESTIMFILEDASLNNMMDTSSDEYDPDELCNYARKILAQLKLPEMEDFIMELPEEDAW